MTPPASPTTRRTLYAPIQTVTNAAQIPSMNKKIGEHDGELKRQKTIMNWILGLTIGISIVSFIALTTFMIDAWRYHADSYQKNTEAINSLKEKNRKLEEKLMIDKMNSMQKEIDSLRQQ